jgi:hypothetical protein
VQSISEHRENNFDGHAKKKQKVLDSVDIFLANKRFTHNTTVCTNRTPPVPALLGGTEKNPAALKFGFLTNLSWPSSIVQK